MPQYLIDVNLPYYFSLWKSEEFLHLHDLDDSMSDRNIWVYAKQHQLTIITKDADFSSRILLTEPPPRIIHLRVGNMKLKELFDFLSTRWTDILTMSQTHKLVNVYRDRIEGVR